MLFLFGAKIALFINFMLGNDIVVKLESDKAHIFVQRPSSEDVSFTASVTTNPFCSASCSYIFEDISRGSVIDSASFSLKPASPLERKYDVSAGDLGSGVSLYRFSLECHAKRTVLCNTDERPTRRAIVVPVQYSLNSDEDALKSPL